MNIMKIVLLIGVLLTGVTLAAPAAKPENLALKAKVVATSEYNGTYSAKHVADGIIPEAGRNNSDGKEWAVKGNNHPDGVTLTLTWASPVAIAEVVYYGRSCYAVEAFKQCSVSVDGAKDPLLTANLEPGHGPQRMTLKQPVTSATLRLKFIGHHACQNPGAAEIEIYSVPPEEKALGPFIAMKPMTRVETMPYVEPVIKETPELAEKLQTGKLGFDKMLLVERNPYHISHVYVYHVEAFKPGGGIHIFTPDATGGKLEKIFDAGGGMVMDCSLSYDAKEILFSYKRKPTLTEHNGTSGHLNHMTTDRDAKYQVFRMDLKERIPVLLTDHYSNNFNPCWLPDGRIAFLSDRKLSFAYCFTSSSPLLYRMERDGSNVFKMSHGYLNDFTPSILNDGRVIYSRWEYVDRPACPIQSLWTLRPDGTKLEGFFGNRVLEPGTFMEARSIGNTRKVLCVLTGHNGSCRGALGIIDPSFGANAQEGIRNITPEIFIPDVEGNNRRVHGPYGNELVNKGPYENPFPIDEKYFLVSNMGTILLRDYDGTECTVVKRPVDKMGFFSPIPIRTVKVPPVITSSLPKGEHEPWGTVVMMDVYNGLEPDVARGEIKQLAIVEEIEKGDFAPHTGIYGYQFPLVSCGATYAAKKLWGYATVEEDGSAHFKVPSGVPFYFLALDKEGRAVQRMRSFTHFQPGEKQSCIGCHADRNYASQTAKTSTRAIASLRQPEALLEPEWGRRNFDYSSIVQPVLDQHCIKCHNARDQPGGVDLTGDKTDFWNVSYEHLARKGTHGEKDPFQHGVRDLEAVGQNPYVKWISSINGAEKNILMIKPRTWGAYPSKLTAIILSGHPDKNGKKRFSMDERSMRRVFAWMDLNVPYYKDSKTNHPDVPGSRMMRPAQLDKTLEDVRKRRCAECHEKVPRKFYTRITQIEDNNFLLAPLAKAAGGTEACGKVVFASKDDPDYQSLLKTFEPITQLMKERPRIDFPGAEYIPHKNAHPQLPGATCVKPPDA
jgi:hypothetical protein